jgi:hypothetical protein
MSGNLGFETWFVAILVHLRSGKTGRRARSEAAPVPIWDHRGPGAVRLWPTAEIVDSDGEVVVSRRRGEQYAQAVLAELKPAYEHSSCRSRPMPTSGATRSKRTANEMPTRIVVSRRLAGWALSWSRLNWNQRPTDHESGARTLLARGRPRLWRAHFEISARSQSRGRPGPRSTTGGGMSR